MQWCEDVRHNHKISVRRYTFPEGIPGIIFTLDHPCSAILITEVTEVISGISVPLTWMPGVVAQGWAVPNDQLDKVVFTEAILEGGGAEWVSKVMHPSYPGNNPPEVKGTQI